MLFVVTEQIQQKISCSGLINTLVCSPDQHYCVASMEEKIHVWQVCTGRLLAVICQHYQPVNVLKFTDDGTYLLTGGDDNRVLVWNFGSVLSGMYAESDHVIPCASAVNTPPRSHIKHLWSDHSLPVTDIYCGVGDLRCRVATTSLDQTCKLYELPSGQLLCSFLFNVGLTKVTMDLAEYWLFVGGTDGSIYQINLFVQHFSQRHHLSEDCGGRPKLYNAHSTPITGLTVSRWSHNLISSSEDSILIWDIASQQILQTVKLKGSVCDIVLAGCDLSFLFKQTPQFHRCTYASRSIQPFHKQLYYTLYRDGETQKAQSAIPIIAQRSLSVCDAPLSFEVEFNCLYSQPIAALVPNKDDSTLVIQALKQEISEVKDVHKRLYDFLMDSVVETK